jgi:hypothetical protein
LSLAVALACFRLRKTPAGLARKAFGHSRSTDQACRYTGLAAGGTGAVSCSETACALYSKDGAVIERIPLLGS